MLFTTSRTSQQALSKYTPFELLYKRKPRLSIEISTLPHGVDEADMQEVRAEDLDALMQAMIEWAEEVNAKAKSNIKKAQEKQKKQFDAKHKPPTFQPGDKVWVYNSRKCHSTGGQVRVELEWTMQDCGADQQRNIPPTE